MIFQAWINYKGELSRKGWLEYIDYKKSFEEFHKQMLIQFATYKYEQSHSSLN